MQYKFHLNNLRIAPRKVRLVAALIRRLPVDEAEKQLQFQSKRAALPVLKLLKSAVASVINNFNLSSDNLCVSTIFVDEGQTLKRFRPRAFGRAGAIHKKTSRVTLVLEEKTPSGAKKLRKKINKVIAKKEAAPKKEISATPKLEAPKEIKPRRKFESITKKVFRRKAIG